MSFLAPKFKSAPAPAAPVIEDTQGAQQDYQDMLRRRRGRAAAVLTNPNTTEAPQTASKALLGS